MDPTTGIALVFGVQETPSTGRDAELYKVVLGLERTLYHGLKAVV